MFCDCRRMQSVPLTGFGWLRRGMTFTQPQELLSATGFTRGPAIPVLAQLLKGDSLQLLGLHGASQHDGVLLIFHLYACLPRFDASLGQRHVGIVAEG